MNKKTYFSIVLVIAIGATVFFINKKPSVIPSVSVGDQKIETGEVEILEAVAAEPSWLVIQTNDNGVPGPVIGYEKINAGSNKNIAVKINKTQATPSLYAMIHEDTGTKGSFDFPKNDLPLMYKMEMVAKVFNVVN